MTAIEEPGIISPNLDSWQKLYNRTLKQGRGFICLGMTGLDNESEPHITAGSIVYFNGKFYTTGDSDEYISGSITDNGTWYAYVYVTATNTAGFKYNKTAPTWDPMKGGWYNGNERAVAKMKYGGGKYTEKMILDCYCSIFYTESGEE